MPKITIQNKNLYYEVHGEGEPLLILNGIMMSTASWHPFKDVLSKDYKLILFDMVDQGQSDKMEGPYTQDLHVEMIKELAAKLELDSFHLFGISYGAEVGIKYAIKYQETIKSLILSNVPFKTTELLRYIASRWSDVFKTYDGVAFYKEVNQHLYAESFYEDHIDWFHEKAAFFDNLLPDAWYDGMIRLLDSGDTYDPSEELHKIKVPTLIIGGGEDRITPVKYQKQVADKMPNARLIIIDGAAHVLPYEKPYAFTAALLGFLNVYDKTINTI